MSLIKNNGRPRGYQTLVDLSDQPEDQPETSNGHLENTGTVLALTWLSLLLYRPNDPFGESGPILDNLFGSIDFGTITALMGPSGAGKSTLLKFINGRNKLGVSVDTKLYLPTDRKIRPCFIVQNVSEHLVSGLTALQSLVYSSKLKNYGTNIRLNDNAINWMENSYQSNQSLDPNSEWTHEDYAKRLLRDLMISDIADTYVEECSGGEQKRLAIALELTAEEKPNLLCIDEPTSGLDSRAAEVVIQSLKNIMQSYSIAIITSIHQPNNCIVNMFDNLYVLAKGGVCVYFGPPQRLRPFLVENNIPIRENDLPIEVLIKVSSKNNQITQGLGEKNRRRDQLLQRVREQNNRQSNEGITQKKVRLNLKHTWYLFARECLRAYQSQKMALFFRFIIIVGVGFITAEFFNKNIGTDDGCLDPSILIMQARNVTCFKREESFSSQNERFQFFVTLAIQFLMTVATVLVFTSGVIIFLNEKSNGWYSTGSYYWAKTLFELPLCLMISTCYIIIVYKLTHQIDEKFRFWGYFGVLTIGVLNAQGLGFLISIIVSHNDKLAIVLSVAVYLINLLLCGFFAPITEMPKWIRDTNVYHLSFAKQTFEMQMYLLFAFDRCPPGVTSYLLCQMDLLDKSKFWLNARILIAHLIFYRILALIVLIMKANQMFSRIIKIYYKITRPFANCFARCRRRRN